MQARPADLAFEDAELMAECKNLDLERGISLPWKRGEAIEQGADDRVKHTQNHRVGSCRGWHE